MSLQIVAIGLMATAATLLLVAICRAEKRHRRVNAIIDARLKQNACHTIAADMEIAISQAEAQLKALYQESESEADDESYGCW